MSEEERKYCKLSFLTLILIFLSISLLSSFHIIHANESVSLSLEPKLIVVPFLDLEQGSFLVQIELKIYNVINLKEFHIDFDYDKNVLEYYRGKIDRTFYLTTGGWTGGELDGILNKKFSGSGTMFTYAFIVLQPGSTDIEVINTELIDESGSVIPYTSSGCTINILTISEWIDREYAELQNKYDSLFSDYVNLNSTYYNLLSEYNLLQYEVVSLEYNVSKLKNQVSILKDEFAHLESEKTTLEGEKVILEGTINTLEDQVSSLKASIRSWQMYTAATLVIGLIIGATVIYMTRRQ